MSSIPTATVSFTTSKNNISKNSAKFNYSISGNNVKKPESINHRGDIEDEKKASSLQVTNIKYPTGTTSSTALYRIGTYTYNFIKYGDLWYQYEFILYRNGNKVKSENKELSTSSGNYTFTNLISGTKYTANLQAFAVSVPRVENYSVTVSQTRSSANSQWPKTWKLGGDDKINYGRDEADVTVAGNGISIILYTQPDKFEWTNKPIADATFNMKASDMNDIQNTEKLKRQWEEQKDIVLSNTHTFSSGETVTAENVRKVASLVGASTSDIQKDKKIYASHFAALRKAVNKDL